MYKLLGVMILLSSSLMPAGVFAESKHANDEKTHAQADRYEQHAQKESHDDFARGGDRERECRPQSTLRTGLVSYWKLDGDSHDSVSTNNGTDTAIKYKPQYGVIGKGASFDGISSAIDLGTPSNLSLVSDMSIAMWVYPLQIAEGASVFAKTVGIGNADNTYDLTVFDDAPLQMVYANGTYYYINSATILPQNKWSFIVFTRAVANTDTRFYINGVDAGLSNNHWAAITPATGGEVYIGRRGNGNYFHGYIDEVGVWNRALTPNEVSDLYNGGLGKSYPF